MVGTLTHGRASAEGRPTVPLSLVVIAKNEARNISRCLNSCELIVDRVVVVDMQTNDNTRELAEGLGARVYLEEFKGFVEQKQVATDRARCNWVLNLDADEALSPELLAEILEIFERGEPSDVDGFLLPRRSFHLGRWIRFGGWYPDYQLRLYHRGRARWGGGLVHERVQAAKVKKLQHPILHWVFKDLTEQIGTNNRYSSLGALELHRKGKKFSLGALMFKPISKFLETYIWKLGFRDGMAGLVIAVGAAYSVFLKQAKLWELERLKEMQK